MQGGYTTFSAGSINQQIAYLQAQIDAIDLEISSLTTQVNGNSSDIATIQGQIITIQGQIIALQSSVATNTSNIATNTADIATIQGQITTIQGQITTIQGQIATIQGQITTLQGTVATNTANITTLQGLVPTFVKVTLSSAQILSAGTTRVQLIATPGSGKAIVPIALYVVSTFGGVAYATNTSCKIQMGGPSNGNLYNFAASTILGLSGTSWYLCPPVTPIGGTNAQAQAGQAMFFSVNTGNPTAGNGTLDFYIYYYVQTL